MRGRVRAWGLSLACLLLAACLLAGCGFGGGRWQEQYDLGVQYLSEENYEQAVLAFTAAIEIDPRQARAYMGRGQAYMMAWVETEETQNQAAADLSQAIELDGKLWEAFLSLAQLWVRMGEYGQAADLVERIPEQELEDEELSAALEEVRTALEAIPEFDENSQVIRKYDDEGRFSGFEIRIRDQAGRITRIYQGTQLDHEYWYDEAGNLIRDYDYGFDRSNEYEYDAAGNNTVMRCYDGDLFTEFITYTYNASGHRSVYGLDGDLDLTLYSGYYGNEAGAESYSGFDGAFLSRKENEYDAAGRITRWAWYNPNSNQVTGYYYEYQYLDGESRVEMTRYYGPSGQKDGRIVYLYDQEGRLVEVQNYSCSDTTGEETLHARITREYDGQGQLARVTYYRGSGELNYCEVY